MDVRTPTLSHGRCHLSVKAAAATSTGQLHTVPTAAATSTGQLHTVPTAAAASTPAVRAGPRAASANGTSSWCGAFRLHHRAKNNEPYTPATLGSGSVPTDRTFTTDQTTTY